jgi:hypothetical protein
MFTAVTILGFMFFLIGFKCKHTNLLNLGAGMLGTAALVLVVRHLVSNDEDDAPVYGNLSYGNLPSSNTNNLKWSSLSDTDNLKWSSLMGPCTRERAMEIILKKKKGGRFPTASELKEEIKSPYYNGDCQRCYWLRDGNSFVSRASGGVIVNPPDNSKAHFVIVWES